MLKPISKCLLILFFGSLIGINAYSQAPMPAKHIGEIQLELSHLNILGSVLYVAAHPDDENTRLLTYLAQGKGYRTTYLSLTRGDGGQNLIGDEKGSLLGLLRTQELLAARKLDGAEQTFSRAIDFGYSKTPEETTDVWDRDEILGDVVWAVRKYQPDVIIARFAEPERGGGGHGHHTTSAIMAREAYHLAADSNAYPEQLEFVDTWQPKKLFWNLYTWRRWQPSEEDKLQITKVNIDEYNPLLGKGYGEIASEARSMHRCQAFGVAKQRGGQTEQLLLLEGPESAAKADIFQGIDITWNRIGEDGQAIQVAINKAMSSFSPFNPAKALPDLLDLYKLLEGKEGYWYGVKRKEVKDLIAYSAGLYFEANSYDFQVAQGDTLRMSTDVILRGQLPVTLKQIIWGASEDTTFVNNPLKRSNLVKIQSKALLAKDHPLSQPYWLESEGKKGIFSVSNQEKIGLPESPASFWNTYIFQFGEENPVEISYESPVVHKYVDRGIGELYRPLVVSPRLTANISKKAYLFASLAEQEVKVLLRSFAEGSNKQTVVFDVPEGWKVEPQTMDIEFASKGEEKLISLKVSPPTTQTTGYLQVKSEDGKIIQGITEIKYEHIPTQTVFAPATSKLTKVNVDIRGSRLAYLMGSGDEVPQSLEQMGYQVDFLEEEEVTAENLRKYDAVIAGIRLYNTRDRVGYLQQEILEYVQNGGNYIVQYNTTRGLKANNIGPYPLSLSRDRVSVEEAPVTILEPMHPAFNTPNKITQADFEGWIQERGLYFAGEWDEKYQPLLEMNDPGEDPKKGSLLVAQYGEGYFVYTGISWFRELPAGVPGAYRLFANLVSLGKEKMESEEITEEK
ncbi:MAG: PIG-L family deacetylase [Bacteroidota bacterium]